MMAKELALAEKFRNIAAVIIAIFLSLEVCYANNKTWSKNVSVQGEKNENFVSDSKIKTVLIFPKGWEMADPIYDLGGTNPLLFSFDQLTGTPDYFTYTITHCDADWNESRLFYTDYMNGFQQNPLNNYRFSFNTKATYAHFELEIPNEQVALKLSGNYVIRVYGSASSDKPVIQWRFRVVEQAVGITFRARQSVDPRLVMTHQQLDCEVFYQELPVTDPFSDLKLVIEQNTIPNNLTPTPQFSRPGSAEYSGLDRLIFNGLNEWRSFDTRSVQYNSVNIEEIKFAAENYHVLLKQDVSRARAKYVSQPDFNGRTSIQGERDYDTGIELEYPIVYFTLSMEELLNDNVYVVGNFTNFEYSDTYKMVYNYERSAYELALPLKQGYYNYMYAVKGQNSSEPNLAKLEGSHSETENSYSVYVYYRQPGTRYDRLVGYVRMN